MTTEIADFSELPKSWTWATISEIGEVITGTTPQKACQAYYGPNYPFFKPTDLNAGFYTKESSDHLSELGMKQARLLPEKAILVTCIGATIGKTGFIRIAGACNQQINAVIARDGILPEFLYFWSISDKFQKQIRKNASATTLPILNKSKFEQLSVPLAPFKEQVRIVQKVEELFSFLDAGVASLRAVQAQLKRYRQAILKAAFEGKLTQQWRLEHKDQNEPAEKLLERARLKKQNLKKYEIDDSYPISIDSLPENWTWTALGNLYDITGGGTPSTTVAEYWGGDTPWITSADIYGLKDIRPRKYVTELGIKNSATNVVPKDSLIVVTRVGLGKVALANTTLCFSQDSQGLVGDSSIINPTYSLFYLSKAVQVFKYKHRGTTIAGVTKKQLAELPFPLPPYFEQAKIAEEVDRLLSTINQTSEAILQQLAISERLRQSILKSAFKGTLVPQDPADEPAEKLLEYIKIEKLGNKPKSNNQLELSQYVK